MTTHYEQNAEPSQVPSKGDEEPAEVIAYRRSCDVEGTGLTHFILVDDKSQER